MFVCGWGREREKECEELVFWTIRIRATAKRAIPLNLPMHLFYKCPPCPVFHIDPMFMSFVVHSEILVQIDLVLQADAHLPGMPLDHQLSRDTPFTLPDSFNRSVP